ncbi:hypothetical protein Dimus_013288 [Dionaea muscipula]
MSSPPREWSWEPRVPIHPSLLEMMPLRIPSPALDSPEYLCQGSEESSFSSDESRPPCELGEGDALCVSGRRVNPYASEEGATSRGLLGVPPSYPLAARLEGRSPKRLRIKLKSRSLGESSKSRTETTTLYVVDAADTLGLLPIRGEFVPSEPSNNESPLKSSMCPAAYRDRRSSRDAEDRPPKPPSAELTRGKGVSSDYPWESQKRRLPTGPIDFQDPFGAQELAAPLGGSACGSSSSVTPASYAKERFKYEMIDGHRVELDSNRNILPRDLRFAGPQPKICGLPFPNDGFICCESNALALAQAMANVSLVDQKAYRHETKGRMAEWMGQDLNWNLVQEAIADRDAAGKKVKTLEEEIAILRGLHTELTTKYNELQDSVRHLVGSLKKERNQSTSHLTELESAQGKCEELERKIERLEKRIAELEQQHPSSLDEMIDRWQVSEEGMAAIAELARPATKAGYNMAFQYFGSYLSEVPADKKWYGPSWPHDDFGVTDQNVPYYITDGPPPPIVIDAEEEGEPGEVNLADS